MLQLLQAHLPGEVAMMAQLLRPAPASHWRAATAAPH